MKLPANNTTTRKGISENP